MNRQPAESRSSTAQQRRWQLAKLAAQAVDSGPHGLAALAGETGHPVTTLRRWARVGRRFGESLHSQRLSFSHYEAVLGIRDATLWLQRAADQGWSVGRLKAETEAAPKLAVPSDSDPIDMAIAYLRDILGPLRRTGRVRDRAAQLAILAAAVAGRSGSRARDRPDAAVSEVAERRRAPPTVAPSPTM